ncbi:hypothetical protein CLV95_11238 [Leptospira borgpetersenii serovar Javanica]|nr:Uncharacterized protein LB4E_1651 [Leptospira borgpetersenii str. 4E]PTM45207.1 hypothetical protein CLV95_11238 [Leptospira borgpetersenii serovar Javanica]
MRVLTTKQENQQKELRAGPKTIFCGNDIGATLSSLLNVKS